MSSCVQAPTPDCIRGIFCGRAPMPDCFPALTPDHVSELQHWTASELQRRTMYPSSNAGLYPRYRKSPRFKEVPDYIRGVVYPRCRTISNAGNALYGASHSRLSFMPDCFRGGAPPQLWVDVLSIFLIGAIYSLTRYIASSPQGVYRSKTRDAPEG